LSIAIVRRYATRHGGRERRFPSADFPASEKLGGHAEGRTECLQVAQVREICIVPGGHEGAGPAVTDVVSGGGHEFRRELRIPAG
jgi:hypothetical protein